MECSFVNKWFWIFEKCDPPPPHTHTTILSHKPYADAYSEECSKIPPCCHNLFLSISSQDKVAAQQWHTNTLIVRPVNSLFIEYKHMQRTKNKIIKKTIWLGDALSRDETKARELRRPLRGPEWPLAWAWDVCVGGDSPGPWAALTLPPPPDPCQLSPCLLQTLRRSPVLMTISLPELQRGGRIHVHVKKRIQIIATNPSNPYLHWFYEKLWLKPSEKTDRRLFIRILLCCTGNCSAGECSMKFGNSEYSSWTSIYGLFKNKETVMKCCRQAGPTRQNEKTDRKGERAKGPELFWAFWNPPRY